MPKIAYIHHNFRISSRAHIHHANRIIAELAADDLKPTVRQIYYQFVKDKIIANNVKEYDNLQSLLNKARLAGFIDWDSIEDRTRELNKFYFSDIGTPQGVLRSAIGGHEVDSWGDQENYVEVWVEKQALIGIIDKACTPWRVPYYASKGYNSQSEQWNSGQRFIDKIRAGKRVILVNLGDHDPSGLDMTQDNIGRLTDFIVHEIGNVEKFELRRIALNMDQIQKYELPPDPAKKSDVRYKKYARKHGDGSWELDALNAKMLMKLTADEIKSHIDFYVWKESEKREEREKQIFKDAADLLENPPPREPPPCGACAKRKEREKKAAKPRKPKK
jgi:hypothetical protein